jgi:cyclic 2,3-diphosphoglycerate synthetase
MSRALALIDGEHYAPVVRDALRGLPHEVVGALLVGGTEKLRGDGDYGVPVVDSLDEALARFQPEVALDLSDEPVLGPQERFRLASRILAHGIAYEGADFSLRPPEFQPFALPSLAVIGTGKRVGKTAVTGYAARRFADWYDLVVVSMGRGGPPEPQVAEVSPTVHDLLELSRDGAHAASDYLETAALAGVPTIGCRRAGGGLAGAPWATNLAEGMRKALEREPELVLFDGSGAAIPPVEAHGRILVAGAHQDPDLVTGYLNAYRILISDLVVLTMAEAGTDYESLAVAVADVKDVPVVATVLRPRPVKPVEGKRVAFFTTAKPDAAGLLERYLVDEHDAADVVVSTNLSNRDELHKDLERTEADVYLVEIKAAAIDVVAEAALERGVEVVFADNDVLAVPGQPDLDRQLHALAEAAIAGPREAVA